MESWYRSMRIIIYAMGKLFEQYKDKIAWEHVVAVVDKKKSVDKVFRGYPILCPQDICNLTYDYIAIFSDKFYAEISQELVGEYNVPQTKIVSWIEALNEQMDVSVFNMFFFKRFIQLKDYKKVLNIGISNLSRSCMSKDSLVSNESALLDAIQDAERTENVNLFDHVYENSEDCTEKYDVAIIWDILQYSEEEIKTFLKHTSRILFFSRHLINGKSILENVKKRVRDFGECTYISKAEGLYGMIETEPMEIQGDVSIYVVTHKEYNLKSDKLYKPLCVGKYYREGYLSDHNGENIAHLNYKINECTALYWIWKNTSSRYVGLNHYRRYFYNDEMRSIDNYLDIRHVSKFMERYDIILPAAAPKANLTVYGQIQNSLDSKLCEEGYMLIRNKIEKYQPDYLENFDDVMNSRNFFWCNLFVTKREILNRYCEWLFSFLIEAAEEINVDGYDAYNQRVIGFFAERMWTVWLRRNKVRIKELPILL